MRRSTLLKWTSLVVLSFTLTFVLMNLLQRDSARAALQEAKPDSGSLTGLNDKGNPLGLCPLKHTSVKADVSGFLSRVTVTQQFHNPFPEKIEAVYMFPLPEDAAVDDMTMQVGERIVKGQIMKREEARATYENAKKLGQSAALLDQERPNIFTQAVANIMPNDEIKITISYVETLKYEDGSYEWVFPMVIAPRYEPAAEPQNDSPGADASPVSASATKPLVITQTERPGHDISIELNVDAGLPIDLLKSETHETDVERPDDNKAVVRLKDNDVIPNKDFVLHYHVAGEKIEDALLAHRDDKGGFFTLILQPPQTVATEDVMPKELVFVLDTSGSMQGFPLDKAKETMILALDNLYPHDTFNVITFSGDTSILFPDPVPATPENVHKAKTFLASRQSYGGTEMMKAVQAALDPSDSQQHLRIACFMTDGQVGNDAEIIEQVQKHKNARVFAMGFGDAPNRYLLDKMTQYGRGEVDYVLGRGQTSDVARRFNARVRNPLLTDIAIDWGTLPVTDVYPKRIPDLFAAKPLIVSGRYSKGASGVIHLSGKLAGQDFLREIKVELPEVETGHDVLSNLWARRRIDELIADGMNAEQNATTRQAARDEITQLGLEFKLMTEFTSFVAVDQVQFNPGEEPKRVDVPVATANYSATNGGIAETVTVTSSAATLNVDSATYSSTIVARQIDNLSILARSVNGLMTLSPGTVTTHSGTQTNGQRATSNNLIIDGVNANFGIAQGGQNPGASAAGTLPALTASGGMNGLTTQESTQEIQVNTFYVKPEFGRVSGNQVQITTEAGTNTFHGSLFEFFGNDALDATDWFANSRSLEQAPHHLNLFGGTFGGPIKRNKSFFFGSFEGLRLRQPMTTLTQVPSLLARQASPAQVFLNAFPLPTALASSDNFAEHASTYSNPARHNAFSVRVDNNVTSQLNIGARYSVADSDASQRGSGGFSLNTTNRLSSVSQALTGSVDYVLSPSAVVEFRANYSQLKITGAYALDNFGGAVVPTSIAPSFIFNLNGRNATLMTGESATNLQRQLNLIGSLSAISGSHAFKFGGDFRKVFPIIGLRLNQRSVFFDGVNQSLTGVATRISDFHRLTPQAPSFDNLSLYAQDEWKQSTKLTLTYGLRWELNPAPSGSDSLAVDQVSDVTNLKLSAPSASLWKTTFTNFAPRFGFTYDPSGSERLVIRGGVGIYYNLGTEAVGETLSDSFPILTGASIFNSPLAANPVSSQGSNTLPLSVFDPNLELPYALNWHLGIQKTVGWRQSLSLSYIEGHGRRLTRTDTLLGQNQTFPFIRLTRNDGTSDHRALQIAFDRSMGSSLSALVSYTIGRTLDNVTEDTAANAFISTSRSDRASSDFDVRHVLHGLAAYQIPSTVAKGPSNRLLRNWTFSSIFNAQSAEPLNVVYAFPTSFGLGYLRPNLVSGQPLFLIDLNIPGGRRINPAAFSIPTALEQGNLGRNSLRGFPLYQIDFSVRRKFNFNERVALQFQVDAFNLMNHPNFEDPLANDLSLGTRFDAASAFRPNLTFGQSASLDGMSVLNQNPFGAFNGTGGARTLRLGVKLTF